MAMKGGRIIKYGKPDDIISNDLIQSLYDVDVEIQSLYDDKIRVCIPCVAI
jgi:iron complex transport system ATP-binding protein